MVFATLVKNALYNHEKKNRGEDRFWKKLRTFRHSADFWGRTRNCYRLARIAVMRNMWHCSRIRPMKRQDLNDLAQVRIEAGCNEHGLTRRVFREGLERSLILIDQKALADLAAWEPRSFKALTDVSKARVQMDKDLHYPGMDHKDVSHVWNKRLLAKFPHDWK